MSGKGRVIWILSRKPSSDRGARGVELLHGWVGSHCRSYVFQGRAHTPSACDEMNRRADTALLHVVEWSA